MQDINLRVKKARKDNFYTQAQLAKAIGMKTTTYSQMEREGNITAEVLKKIAHVLNIDIRYFLYGDEFVVENKPEEPPEEPAEPEFRNVYDLLDREETYMIMTYRNLKPKERSAAYSLFMDNFSLNVIHKKREQTRLKNI